jgi:anti-sigma factor RsiW
MCDFDKNLIAFMDGELADNEAATIAQHVSTCDDCRVRLASYENVSRDFAAYYAAAAPKSAVVGVNRSVRRWAPYVAGAAAAIVIALILLPRAHQPTQPATQEANAPPSASIEPAVVAIQPVTQPPALAKRRAPSRRAAQSAAQPPSEPVVQIVIPADAMFPPGAMPDGVVYVANLNYTNGGAMPGYRLQQ